MIRAARSLSGRLLAGAALWIAAALLVTGLILSALFRAEVERTFTARLALSLDQLAANLETAPDGKVRLARPLSEPLFARPYSGWYWQVEDGGVLLRSRSLWDLALDLPDNELADGVVHQHRVSGPENQTLIALERRVVLADRASPLRLAVAAPESEYQPALRRFDAVLIGGLGLLGLGLVGAALLQVRFGLRPLALLRRRLAAVRDGRARRIGGSWPTEVMPLVEDLDALLAHDAALIERARTQSGNLAHALKTPLSILANEAARAEAVPAEAVRQQTDAMRRHIDRYLVRASAAVSTGVPGARTPVVAAVEDLARVLRRLHPDRDIALRPAGGLEPFFRGDRQDLEEMFGNLMENACKWARRHVVVTIAAGGGRLRLVVEDDGPGLPDAIRAGALQRGRRLDEAVPGSGLGLAIVGELVELYGGRIDFGTAASGGARVELDLPQG